MINGLSLIRWPWYSQGMSFTSYTWLLAQPGHFPALSGTFQSTWFKANKYFSSKTFCNHGRMPFLKINREKEVIRHRYSRMVAEKKVALWLKALALELCERNVECMSPTAIANNHDGKSEVDNLKPTTMPMSNARPIKSSRAYCCGNATAYEPKTPAPRGWWFPLTTHLRIASQPEDATLLLLRTPHPRRLGTHFLIRFRFEFATNQASLSNSLSFLPEKDWE